MVKNKHRVCEYCIHPSVHSPVSKALSYAKHCAVCWGKCERTTALALVQLVGLRGVLWPWYCLPYQYQRNVPEIVPDLPHSWHRKASEMWEEHFPKGRFVGRLLNMATSSDLCYLEGACQGGFTHSYQRTHGKMSLWRMRTRSPDAQQRLFRLLFAVFLRKSCSSCWVIFLPCTWVQLWSPGKK